MFLISDDRLLTGSVFPWKTQNIRSSFPVNPFLFPGPVLLLSLNFGGFSAWEDSFYLEFCPQGPPSFVFLFQAPERAAPQNLPCRLCSHSALSAVMVSFSGFSFLNFHSLTTRGKYTTYWKWLLSWAVLAQVPQKGRRGKDLWQLLLGQPWELRFPTHCG